MEIKTNFYVSYILWLVIALLLISWYTAYISHQTNDKIEKIYSSIIQPVSCDSLPYWVQEKIEQTYENITSSTCNIKK
jgi:hypothetical protein